MQKWPQYIFQQDIPVRFPLTGAAYHPQASDPQNDSQFMSSVVPVKTQAGRIKWQAQMATSK